MKIGVAGAGAVGCLFGALLHNSGHQVTFLARGTHLDEMKRNGLNVNTENGNLNIKGTFTDNPNDLSDAELILFCVKSNDTEAMAQTLFPIVNQATPIVTLQNGIYNEEILSEVFGTNRILSCATYIQASITKPGQLHQQGRIKLVVGELDESLTESCFSIVDIFQQAGVDAVRTQDIRESKWKKLLYNITFNPLSAVTKAKTGDILDDNQLRKTAEKICIEAISVAKQAGVSIDQERMISTIFNNAARARNHQTSMLQDRIRGRRMEIEAMCGVIVEKAKHLNISIPHLETLYHILGFIDKSESYP